MFKYFITIIILSLLLWISFVSPSMVKKHYFVAQGILAFVFIISCIKKRFAIFQLKDFPLWFFIVAIGINVFFAQQQDVAFKAYLALAVPMVTIYYLVAQAFRGASFQLLAKTICIFSILVALGGIFESVFAFNPIYAHFIENPYYHRYIRGFVRPMSTQFNPTVLGSFLLGCLPFSLLLFKQQRSLFKSLGAIGIVLGTVVIILTFSRGVLLGLIAMVIFYLFAQHKVRSIVIFLLILILVISIFSFLPYPLNRFGAKMVTLENRGILSTYRFNRCIMAGRIIKNYPLTGLGLKHFRIRFNEFYPGPDPNNMPYEFKIADNMYLTILAETGTIGFLGFLIFIFSLLKRGWARLARSNLPGEKSWPLLVSLMACTGLLVNMGAYELFYWPNPYLLFCIVLGCIVGLGKDADG